jgi:N-glycosylase/DNA lyase
MMPQYVIADLVFHLLQALDSDPTMAPSYSRLDDGKEIWHNLIFCILSSQVRTDTAARAAKCVLQTVPFFQEVISLRDVYRMTKTVLAKKELGYRFPNGRASQIAHSWFAFAQMKDALYEYLDTFCNETAAREAVKELFPGLGLKQASMFLRNIGYSYRLCIIDTHVLWYCARMGQSFSGTLTPKRYVQVEEYLLQQSDELGVEPNMFDMAIWAAVTAFKARSCTMQFA